MGGASLNKMKVALTDSPFYQYSALSLKQAVLALYLIALPFAHILVLDNGTHTIFATLVVFFFLCTNSLIALCNLRVLCNTFSCNSIMLGAASSAAAVGVGARKSATKSAIVKSVSWPTAEIIEFHS